MAVLLNLWCVLESSILPHKWYTLGYFINPLLLMGCQFFLFGKFVLLRLTFCISFPLRALWQANLWLCSSTRRCIYRLVILSGLDDDSIIRQYGSREMEDKWILDFDADDPLTAMVLHESYTVKEFCKSSVATPRGLEDQEVVLVYNYYVKEVDEESENEFYSEDEEYERVTLSNAKEGRCEKKEQKGNEQHDEGGKEMQNYYEEETEIEDRVISHVDHTQQQQIPVLGYQKVKEEEERISVHDIHQRQGRQHHHLQPQQPVLDFNEKSVEEAERIAVQIDGGQDTETASHIAENIAGETVPELDSGPANTDEFHMDFTRKMKALDQLSQERLHALSTMLNTHAEDQTLYLSLELQIESLASSSYTIGSVVKEKYLLRNIISGLEWVYVGQSCLSWEALQHQYDSVATSVPGAVFHGSVTGKFQLFSNLLERFIENDKTDGKWVWSYIQGRCSGYLLQVPEVSGYTEVDGGRIEEATTAKELLMIIYNAIEIYYHFLRANNDRPMLKLKKLFKLDSQVEDPNDIGLFDRLKKEVSKKQRRLDKFAKGRNSSWKKISAPFRDTESKVILFSKIDLELASRVLRMFVISTKQLQWCEERLNSIQLSKGRLIRNSTGSSFPAM